MVHKEEVFNLLYSSASPVIVIKCEIQQRFFFSYILSKLKGNYW